MEEHKQKFRDLLLNGPLEKYTEDLYNCYLVHNITPSNKRHIEQEQENFILLIERCRAFLIILSDLREGVIRWVDMTIECDEDILEYEIAVQNKVCGYIKRIHSYFDDHCDWSVLIETALKARWYSISESVIGVDLMEYDEEGRLTEDSFLDTLGSINKCLDESKQLMEYSTELMTMAFLDQVKKTGVKLNNDVYREVYKCLYFFGWLDYDQWVSHQKSSSKYIREQFIKQKFNRLDGKEKIWDDLIIDVIDPDWFDPRK